MVTKDDSFKEQFLRDVLEGLSSFPKTISCKYFYDKVGSDLFKNITELEEYYPTRTEISILKTFGPQIANHIGQNSVLLDYGSGSLEKINILLNFLEKVSVLFPIDLAEAEMVRSIRKTKTMFPKMVVQPIVGDFTKKLDLDLSMWPNSNPIGVFLGSTIGNFTPENIVKFLKTIAHSIGQNGMLLIGVDLKKTHNTLNAAYNDRQGVTAKFNKNLLVRINNDLKANFDLNYFRHLAFYNEDQGRVEMHLQSVREQFVMIGQKEFVFERSETIHTENSYKFCIMEFQNLAKRAGFTPVDYWTDKDELYSVQLFRI